jgi:hypothetical protein
MGTRRIYNGTPVMGDWLCRTCSHAHIQKGYAESEELIQCAHFCYDSPQPLPFKIRECTLYSDKRQSDLRGMEQSAWILVTPKAGRAVGFVKANELKDAEGDNIEIIPEE